jgi:hypothetical protein
MSFLDITRSVHETIYRNEASEWFLQVLCVVLRNFGNVRSIELRFCTTLLILGVVSASVRSIHGEHRQDFSSTPPIHTQAYSVVNV